VIFVLDTTVLNQLLARPDFYTAVPAYFFLREQGLAAAKQYGKAVAKGREDCPSCSDKGLINPVASAFVRHTKQLYEQQAQLLQPLREYIARSVRLRPGDQIRLYYRKSGQTHHLDF